VNGKFHFTIHVHVHVHVSSCVHFDRWALCLLSFLFFLLQARVLQAKEFIAIASSSQLSIAEAALPLAHDGGTTTMVEQQRKEIDLVQLRVLRSREDNKSESVWP
jgi:hypothetical protein